MPSKGFCRPASCRKHSLGLFLRARLNQAIGTRGGISLEFLHNKRSFLELVLVLFIAVLIGVHIDFENSVNDQRRANWQALHSIDQSNVAGLRTKDLNK